MTSRFKEIRKAEHLTQAAMAAKLGVTRNYIYMIESGATPLTERTFSDVCRIFGVSPEWLRTGAGAMYAANAQSAAAIEWATATLAGDDTFKRRFLEVLARLDPAEWDLVEKLINELAEKEKDPDA